MNETVGHLLYRAMFVLWILKLASGLRKCALVFLMPDYQISRIQGAADVVGLILPKGTNSKRQEQKLLNHRLSS